MHRRCRRKCVILALAGLVVSTCVVNWLFGFNDRLSLEQYGNSRGGGGLPIHLAPWPELVERMQVAALIGGGLATEDRWNKYSLNSSLRSQAIDRLNARMNQFQPDAAYDNKRSARRAYAAGLPPQPEDPGTIVDLLMSELFSGSLNEHYRRKYLRSDIRRDSVEATPSSIWMHDPRRQNDTDSDRIIAQMFHVPRNYKRLQIDGTAPVVKSIYLDSGFGDMPLGRHKFEVETCLVDACRLTKSPGEMDTADMRLFDANSVFYNLNKPPGQIWGIYILESPPNTVRIITPDNVFNWTATYRWDSTIVTPYAKFMRYHSHVTTRLNEKGVRRRNMRTASTLEPGALVNYAKNKTKMVAWFVSNCFARNNRHEYVQELSKYVSVDIYGACGKLACLRSDANCFKLLSTDYKFYLSFENSNCDYYITEKLFENALLNNVVPIVMGARQADYLRAAPHHSYIHVDQFQSARDLAKYLHRLDQSDALYNKYFAWKPTGEFINTKFWCRLCALLHDESKPNMWYTDVNKWWSQDGACRKDRWN